MNKPKVEPTKADLEEAKDRAQRASVYATLFPDLVRPGEVIFQDSDWQLAEIMKFR